MTTKRESAIISDQLTILKPNFIKCKICTGRLFKTKRNNFMLINIGITSRFNPNISLRNIEYSQSKRMQSQIDNLLELDDI